MIAVTSYSDICNKLCSRFESRYAAGRTCEVYLTGILFAPPMTDAGREILPRLNDYHYRSADDTDFFLAGYGAYWNVNPELLVDPKQAPATEGGKRQRMARSAMSGDAEGEEEGDAEGEEENVALAEYGWLRDPKEDKVLVVAKTLDRSSGVTTKWLYSSKLFCALMEDVKRVAPGWDYSGEADLVLADALYEPLARKASVDFSTAVVLDLEKLKKESNLMSVARLFENIFAFSKQSACDGIASRLSDRFGLGVGRRWLEGVVSNKLPANLGKLWTEGRHYAVRDLTRK